MSEDHQPRTGHPVGRLPAAAYLLVVATAILMFVSTARTPTELVLGGLKAMFVIVLMGGFTMGIEYWRTEGLA